MLAVRSAPAAAMASGVSVVRTKLVLFTLSAGLAGFGGVMYASYNTRVTATDFTAMTGLIWLAVVVAAGLRRPQFAVVAGLVYALVPHLVSDYVTESVHLPVILFGLAGLALANDPDGYCAAVSVRVHRRRPAGAEATEAGASTAGGTPVGPEAATGGGAPVGTGSLTAAGVTAVEPGTRRDVTAGQSATATATASGTTNAESSTGSGATAIEPATESGVTAGSSRKGRAFVSGAPNGDRAGFSEAGVWPTAPASPAEASPALELRAIRAGYDGAPVLHGVDLAVHPGEILALLGPNGAGKSTTCRVAAGLVAPLGGQVYVAGREATREGAVRRSRAGVVLAPEGRGIFPALTIEENLALYLPGKDQREAVYERFPGLAGRRGVPAGSLSGGEQQMLALAPLLQRPPKVLIADEPSLGLAPRVVEDVFRLLTELRDTGTALLLVEEKATEVLGVADTVAYLAQGRMTWCGPRASVEADRLTEAYLGLAATPEPGPAPAPESGADTDTDQDAGADARPRAKTDPGNDPGPGVGTDPDPDPDDGPNSGPGPDSPVNPTVPSQTRGVARP